MSDAMLDSLRDKIISVVMMDKECFVGKLVDWDEQWLVLKGDASSQRLTINRIQVSHIK